MLKIGIIGIPNAGKSTFFNALTGLSVPAECYPFCTVKPNTAIVHIPDDKLDRLSEFFPESSKTYETLEFIDIAGLVEGAHNGEGLGNQFLSEIRGVDAIVHIIRLFEDSQVPHPLETIDPIRDAKIVENELIESDREIAKRNLEKLESQLLKGDKSVIKEVDTLKKFLGNIEKLPISFNNLTYEETDEIKKYQFLILKPILYVANLDEKGLDLNKNNLYINLFSYAHSLNRDVISIPAKLEKELNELNRDEEELFRKDLNLEKGLTSIIKTCYTLLNLITFYTFVGGKEIRAWAIKEKTHLIDAARMIHSDIADGFIKGEIIPYDEFIKYGSEVKAKEHGVFKIEGREYIVKNGDIIIIKFKV